MAQLSSYSQVSYDHPGDAERDDRQEESVTFRSVGATQFDRAELDKQFKPLFESHGPEGVSIKDIRAELSSRDNIPPDKLNAILQKFDRNKDQFLTYDEFVRMMQSDIVNKKDKNRMRGFLAIAIQNIVPSSQQDDFLQTYSCCPPPVFMIIITIIEVIVFAVYAYLLSQEDITVTATTGIATYSPFLYTPYRRYEAWRFITYMLLHQGYLHLIGNMIVQLLLGLPLELAHKWWRVILVYILGVLAGSLAHSITDYTSSLAGASGGTYALMGGHLAATIINWKEMNYKVCSGSVVRVITSAPVRLTFILIYVFADTGVAIYRRYFAEDKARIGIAAHIGGFLAGLVLGVLVLRNIKKLSWELKLGWVGLSIYLAFIVVAVLFNSLYPEYPATDWRPCCPR